MIGVVMIAGFVAGAAGSVHCIGMCGPLSLLLPAVHLSKWQRFLSLLLYQLGRVITYALLGVIAAFAGRGLYVAGVQQYFSVAIGCLVLALALTYFLRKRLSYVPALHRPYRAVQRMIGLLLKNNTGTTGFFLFGMVNGLLPCGMVYIAILTSMSFSGWIQAPLFMAMFGFGTLPAMMVAAYLVQRMKWQTRLVFRRVIPFFMLAVGLLLLLRGLNLGIPFISPLFPSTPGNAVVCHP